MFKYMDVFNPELGEFSESKFGENRFSPDIQEKLQNALDQNKEQFPDVVQCPQKACGFPLKIKKLSDHLRVHCTNCGWKTIVQKSVSKQI